MINSIQKMMSTAKRYGAIFNNVKLVESNGSFVVQAIKQDMDSLLKIPYTLALPIDMIEITDSSHYIKADIHLPTDLRNMFNLYLDYILSKSRILSLETFIHDFQNVSTKLTEKISPFGLGIYNKKYTYAELKIKLLQARIFNHNGEKILLPFIDFIDHDSEYGNTYNITNDSVSIQRKANSNSLFVAIYNSSLDPFVYLQTYQFSPKVLNAFSMSLRINIDDTTTLTIGRDMSKIKVSNLGLLEQEYILSKNNISLPLIWLGNKNVPRKPYWSFKNMWENKLKKTNTLYIYSTIKSLNIMTLIDIIRLCDDEPQTLIVSMIKECALHQLELIGGGIEDNNFPNFTTI